MNEENAKKLAFLIAVVIVPVGVALLAPLALRRRRAKANDPEIDEAVDAS